MAGGDDSWQTELGREGGKRARRQVRGRLPRARLARQWLADEAKVSLSTIEKALSGRRPFTLATVVRLEDALGTSLRGQASQVQTGTKLFVPESMGAYARPAVQWLEGTYLTVRPSFSEKNAIFAYLTSIAWDTGRAHLTFSEAARTDIAWRSSTARRRRASAGSCSHWQPARGRSSLLRPRRSRSCRRMGGNRQWA